MNAKSQAAGEGDTVTLPRAEYQALLDRLEDLEDALTLKRAEAASAARDRLPVELVERLLAGEHPLRLWREHRGLTLQALHERSGVGRSYIADIETRKKPGSVDALRKLAAALALELDDLVA